MYAYQNHIYFIHKYFACNIFYYIARVGKRCKERERPRKSHTQYDKGKSVKNIITPFLLGSSPALLLGYYN
jgi:hypothetical protein